MKIIKNIMSRSTKNLFLSGAMAVSFAATGCAHAADPQSDKVVATADEPGHLVILEDPYVRVMRVMILPGHTTMWHEQHLDYVNTHILGSPVHIEYKNGPSKDAMMATGNVRFGPHTGKSEVDRVQNTGDTLNQQVAFEIKQDGPHNFGPADRSKVVGFTTILDKKRVRGWHVKLEPGESTGDYLESGPGVRVIFSGDRLMSVDKGDPIVHEVHLGKGDAFLLKPGTRRIVNGGYTTLEFNEYEIL